MNEKRTNIEIKSEKEKKEKEKEHRQYTNSFDHASERGERKSSAWKDRKRKRERAQPGRIETKIKKEK